MDPTLKAKPSFWVILFKRFYSPFLLNKWVRPSVVVIFLGWLCASLAMAPKLDVGLEQEIAMPG